LLPATGSVVPAGTVTVAVFVIDPGVVAVPVTVSVTELPAPEFNCTVERAIALPDPDAVPHAAVPADAHVHATPVRFDGTVSATVAPDVLLGPPFVAVIV
jgi:hypothetical protein